MQREPTSSAQESYKRLIPHNREPKIGILFIAVPGVGTTKPDLWHDGIGKSWLRAIKCNWAGPVGIYYFDNQLWSEETSSWRSVEEEGENFLENLQGLVESEEQLRECPIVLFAHSLGGSIVKRAISLLYEAQTNQPCRQLLNNIFGTVFLACPHPRSEDERLWDKIGLILRTCTKGKAKHISVPEIAAGVPKHSLDFELAFAQLPILSFYETVESKTGRFRDKTLLVDRTFAEINATKNYPIYEVAKADHFKICHIPNGGREVTLITNFINDDVQRVYRRSKKISEESALMRQLEFDESTVRSDNTFSTQSKEITETSKRASINLQESEKPESISKLPCYVISITRNQGFFGRITVLQMIESALCYSVALDSEHNKLKAYALCGPGGIGKSEVAAEFVYRVKDQGKFDAIFWVRADEPGHLLQDFGKIAMNLGLINETPADIRDAFKVRDRVLKWLARPAKSNSTSSNKESDQATWLMVFDDVNNSDILEEYYPPDCPGSVLITTRDPHVRNYVLSDDRKMVMPPFEKDEATSFLLKETSRGRPERKAAAEVAQLLGGHPLAIVSMAWLIGRHDFSFPEFKSRYEAERSRRALFSQLSPHSKTRSRYHHNLSTVWKFDDLQQSTALLDVISLMDANGIPESIIKKNPACRSWKEYPQNISSFEDARLELLKSSLVTRDRNTAVIKTHTIVQAAVRANMGSEKFNTLYRQVFRMISAVWPYEDRFGFGHENSRWTGPKGCEEFFGHILQIEKFFPSFNPEAALTRESLELYNLALDSAWFSIMCSRFTETGPLLDMAEKIAKGIRIDDSNPPDPDVREEFEKLKTIYEHHRGCLALHTNEPRESLKRLNTFVDLVRAKLGDRPSGTDRIMGVGWNELGNAYLQNGMIKDAEICYNKSIDALKALDGSTEISISMPLINLGFAYWLNNRLEEASKTFEDALRQREIAYGRNDRSSFITGKLLLGYGNVKAAQGYKLESYILHHRCLLRYRATVGNHHNRTGDACVRFSDHLAEYEEYDAALEHLNQAIEIFDNREHSKFIPERARAFYKKGKVLRALGESDSEQESFARAMKLFKQINPNDTRTLDQLTDADFDGQVMFWSR